MSSTYREIQDQPAAWAGVLATAPKQWRSIVRSLRIEPRTNFLFIGSGASLYIAQSAARSFQYLTGHVSHAVPSSEIFLDGHSTIPSNAPVVAFLISRSGATSEALIAADYLVDNCANATVIAVTCGNDTELEKKAQHVLALVQGAEKSVVMTKSFTSMLLALQVVAGQIAQNKLLLSELNRLPAILHDQMGRGEEFAAAVAEDLRQDHFIYLGLGLNHGLAEEGCLNLKEMTQTPCEAYNPLEFRHGPISTVGKGTSMVMLEALSERGYLADLELELKGHGAIVSAIGPYPSSADRTLALPDGLSDIARSVLYAPPLQLIAYRRAIAQGLDPDRPRNLNRVVVLRP